VQLGDYVAGVGGAWVLQEICAFGIKGEDVHHASFGSSVVGQSVAGISIGLIGAGHWARKMMLPFIIYLRHG
jgi:hypothetical protein